MLYPRIIPCLLLKDRGLVKTVRFSEGKYVGDPLNAVRIFNEKEVDELMFIDIDATRYGREPDYALIEHIAAECNMPLCYGGGVKTADQARRLLGLGVEKVALSSAIVEHPGLIGEIAAQIGSQSVVTVLDFRKKGLLASRYEIYTHNGTQPFRGDPWQLIREFESRGIGELVVISIDNDGLMKGYDLTLVEKVRACVSVPVTVLGGAGSSEDISGLIRQYPIIGAAAGSLFVFKGPYKAVLINYPDKEQKQKWIIGR